MSDKSLYSMHSLILSQCKTGIYRCKLNLYILNKKNLAKIFATTNLHNYQYLTIHVEPKALFMS